MIAEHVRPVLQEARKEFRKTTNHHSWQHEMFEDILLSTEWVQEVINNPKLSAEMCASVVDFIGNMKPAKKREINTVRLAATIWYTKMSVQEFNLAMQDSQKVFSQLLGDEVLTAAAKIDHAKRPDIAFDTKRRAIQQLSPYAFAGIPMLPEQVDIIASLCQV